jgi:F-type H+-transporting ATPase subunit delta
MANYKRIARPYAKAVFEYALEQNKVEAWLEFLQSAALMSEDKRVKYYLAHPRLTGEQKKQMFFDVLTDSTKEQKCFLNTLAYFQRFVILPDIVKLYKSLLQKHNNELETTLWVAYPLDEKQQQGLQKALEKYFQKRIKLHIETDKNIIGGAVIRAQDFVIDGSVRGRLKRLKQQLMA